MKILRHKYFISVLSALVLGLTFAYGILVGRFKVFPYSRIKKVYFSTATTVGIASPVEGIASKGSEATFSRKTDLAKLSGRKFNLMNEYNLSGKGGALERAKGEIIGVDGKGKFFHYKMGGELSKLSLSIDQNRDKFTKHVDETEIPGAAKKRFRILDMYTLQKNLEKDKIKVLLSYHYWKVDKGEKTVRLAQANFESIKKLLNKKDTTKKKWEVIYESSPPIDGSEPPYHSVYTNHVGGRIAISRGRNLYLSLGDYRFNGFTKEHIAPQDDSTSYGKIIKINLNTLKSTQFAKGLRNPEGLHVDSRGRLWETEHGPFGGDELNLIKKGANYGWPLVTYGREVTGDYAWPYVDLLGRHDGYARPYHVWKPYTGISNLIQVEGHPPEWDGDLLVGSLAGLKLFRIRFREERGVIRSEEIRVGERVRDLVQAKDGTFVLFSDNGRFIEIKTKNKK